VFLPYDKTPAVAHIQILLGNAKPRTGRANVPASPNFSNSPQPSGLARALARRFRITDSSS
jgi:hypothetical protein